VCVCVCVCVCAVWLDQLTQSRKICKTSHADYGTRPIHMWHDSIGTHVTWLNAYDPFTCDMTQSHVTWSIQAMQRSRTRSAAMWHFHARNSTSLTSLAQPAHMDVWSITHGRTICDVRCASVLQMTHLTCVLHDLTRVKCHESWLIH